MLGSPPSQPPGFVVASSGVQTLDMILLVLQQRALHRVASKVKVVAD